MSWSEIFLICVAFFGILRIVLALIGYRMSLQSRRCEISREDAAWLADVLHDRYCPACSGPLARHR